MNILLLGKDGQVGTELKRTLLPLGHVMACGRSDLNLQDLSGLRQLLNTHQPDLIVNAAAYTAVDKAERDEETAFIINEKVVAVLADYAKNNKALLIHYSTDYVFDGKKTEAYLETDTVNPLNCYGASKLAGEQAIIKSGCHFLIFRTSWVFSANGNNFIKTILQLAKERESLRVVADQHGAPTSAELIADITAIAIAGYRWGKIETGIYHLTAKGSTTWYHLACYTVDKAMANGIELKLARDQIHPISTKEYPLPAARPINSILDTSKLCQVLNLHVADWDIYVSRMINQLNQMELCA